MASLPAERALRGRVFARRRAFLQLPLLEQHRTRALATFLDESHVFRQRRVGFHHSIEGVSCDELADVVLGYLEKHPQLLEQQQQQQQQSPAPSPTHAQDIDAAPLSSPASAAAARVAVVSTLNRKQVVWKYVDALVLSGVLAIYDEADDKVAGTKLNDFARPGVMFVPTRPSLSPSNAKHQHVSVWHLHDDAILAGTFQGASKLSKATGGRNMYFLVDGTHNVLYWFESDGATAPKGSMLLLGAVVQSTGYAHATSPTFQVKITCATSATSVSMFGSDTADWINPLRRCGAVYDMTPLPAYSKLDLMATVFAHK